MIDGLKPYPEYKDSSLAWLGDVPAHWQVRRLKYLLRERDTRSMDGAEQLLRVSQFTGVTERRRVDGGDVPDTRAESLIGYKRVESNELVVNIMLAWNGSMGVSSYSGIASPAYCVYRFGPAAKPWYYHHLLRSPAYKGQIKAVSTGVVESRLRLYTESLYRIEALLPPVGEQIAIVRFLDYADRRIRRYIRAKQKLIKLLEEQKQAIIHRAVTRGLDPSVRLKPSGVAWLGGCTGALGGTAGRALCGCWQRFNSVAREPKLLGWRRLPLVEQQQCQQEHDYGIRPARHEHCSPRVPSTPCSSRQRVGGDNRARQDAREGRHPEN
jgi:type I restriction enzyme S subunit